MLERCRTCDSLALDVFGREGDVIKCLQRTSCGGTKYDRTMGLRTSSYGADVRGTEISPQHHLSRVHSINCRFPQGILCQSKVGKICVQ